MRELDIRELQPETKVNKFTLGNTGGESNVQFGINNLRD